MHDRYAFLAGVDGVRHVVACGVASRSQACSRAGCAIARVVGSCIYSREAGGLQLGREPGDWPATWDGTSRGGRGGGVKSAQLSN
jgi:hypothetical protein